MSMSDARPVILFVGAFPKSGREVFGGMVTSCRALLRSSLPERAALELLDSTQLSHPPPSLPVRAWFAGRRVVEFIRRFEHRRPTAVLLFVAVGASAAEKSFMAWYARLRGVPALMFPRGGALMDVCQRSAFTRWWVRHGFRGARMVLCQGARWQSFARELLGFEPEALPVVPNWTATPELLDLGRRRQPRANGPVRLLFVGWLDREKGVGELLQSIRELAPQLDFELTLAGEGNLSGQVTEAAATPALRGRIQVRGWLTEGDLRDAYAGADVFVLPSWAEGLPNAMIEAMAAGLACVVSDVGNVSDVVADRDTALLIPPGDGAALTRALREVITDPALRARLGAAGHAVAAGRFGVERAVDQILDAVDWARAPSRRS
jgi:glycosyltransferase involved in cell wall biosynthesis